MTHICVKYEDIMVTHISRAGSQIKKPKWPPFKKYGSQWPNFGMSIPEACV